MGVKMKIEPLSSRTRGEDDMDIGKKGSSKGKKKGNEKGKPKGEGSGAQVRDTLDMAKDRKVLAQMGVPQRASTADSPGMSRGIASSNPKGKGKGKKGKKDKGIKHMKAFEYPTTTSAETSYLELSAPESRNDEFRFRSRNTPCWPT